MLRGDSKYTRNLLTSVPSYRHYIRSPRTFRARTSTTSHSLPSFSSTCVSIFLYIILAACFMLYIKSTTSIYSHHWTWKNTSNTNKQKSISMQQSLDTWLNKYPPIEPHRAHKGYTCDEWNCQTTFDHSKEQWMQPRKQYLVSDKQKYHEWIETHNSQNGQLTDSTQICQYIFIGDSITYSWNYHTNIFNKHFNNGIIYAQSGDKIHEIGWRLKDGQGNGFKKMKQCLLNGTVKQKSMFLLIGTNDIGAGATYDIALNDYMVLLHQLLDFVMDINGNGSVSVVLYVMAIFPRGETYVSFNDRQMQKEEMDTFENWNVDNQYFYAINFMNDYLKSFADKHVFEMVKYIDCNDGFLDDNHRDIVEFKDKNGEIHEYRTGVMSIDVMEDMLHLTEKGYERWANCILKHLN